MTTKPTKLVRTSERQILKSQEMKECFVITPIGSPESEIFKKTEGLINSALRPVLKDHGFIPLPAHHIDSTGSINKQIIEKIVNSELVIANLTGVNPNVMYELAIRHSFGKRVITVAESNTKLPFDIIDQRTIFYQDSMHGLDFFKTELSKSIKKCLAEDEESQNISNPIFDAVRRVAEIKNLPKEDQDVLGIIIEKLNELTHKVNSKDSPEVVRLTNFQTFEMSSCDIFIKTKNKAKTVSDVHALLNNKELAFSVKENRDPHIVKLFIDNIHEHQVKPIIDLLERLESTESIDFTMYPF